MSLLTAEIGSVERALPQRVVGRVAALRGLTVLADDLPLPVGTLVSVGADRRPGEIVGFTGGRSVIMLLGQTLGVRPGDDVVGEQVEQSGPVGERLCGRVVNALGRPIDGRGPIPALVQRPLSPEPVGPMARRAIDRQLVTGVRVIDLMTPLGRGQRMGVFAGPGVGKSTLLGQIARGTEADVNVIALIGERGREVREFIEKSLGERGLARSVVVAATGDESPLMRLRGAKLACAAAEHFRDLGLDVLLMMDSVTRFAHAQRQVGLSVGEPPATKGFTPSVFSEMALLLERAGAVEGAGSITGLYTILVEGDDMTEPISDAARGILDGHVILSRKLAQRGHFPAVDVLDSVSRVTDDVADKRHRAGRQQMVRLLAAYKEVEELVQIGAYASGSDAEADTAIELLDAINALLTQTVNEQTRFDQDRDTLVKLALDSGERVLRRRKGA